MYLLGLSTEIVVLKFLAMLWYVVPFNFWKRDSHFIPQTEKLTRYTLKTKIWYDYRTCQTIITFRFVQTCIRSGHRP